ncbi:MAG: bifunctional phosphopantothenoylcysteine decarboxylase/phosphopantothenate--cysteine ligase CoaBC [Syntrophaceae bacterium]
MLKDKKIILGITGGIAAYKAAELTRALVKKGAQVKVIMTRNAQEFITPLTLQTLSNNPVYTEMFALVENSGIGHISLADFAELVIVAPATANIIGKVAGGLADDLLSTTIMATKAPVIFCPAMNTNMYSNEIVRANIVKLAYEGYNFVEPASGELACGTWGSGRLAEIEDIIEEAEFVLAGKDLAGEKVLVTAGPTREPFDPVRFISNYSSGKMGYAIAAMARRRGAEVTLVSGPCSLEAPRGVKCISVNSAIDMRNAVVENMPDSSIIIKAAAVADYRPAQASASKIKKKKGPLSMELERNPDIIEEVGRSKGDRILVGFAMETDNLIENARGKLAAKNMDMIVANDLSRPDAGFQADTNLVKIIDAEGSIDELPLMDKTEVANRILDKVVDLKSARKKKKKK